MPRQIQMKIVKTHFQALPERPRALQRHTRKLQCPFDRVAYAAALEVLG